jgi:hypothetical protein
MLVIGGHGVFGTMISSAAEAGLTVAEEPVGDPQAVVRTAG